MWLGPEVHKGSRWSVKGQMKGGKEPEGCGQERQQRHNELLSKYCNAGVNSTPRIDPTLSLLRIVLYALLVARQDQAYCLSPCFNVAAG